MDTTLKRLRELHECAVVAIEPEVCKTFIHPGPNAPWDVCESRGNKDGQLWVAHTFSTPHWPSPDGQPHTCPTQFTATIEVGIVRCAATVNDQGNAPSGDRITDDAEQQQADRWSLYEAIVCCFKPEYGRDLVIENWTAIPPDGGCFGGTWTIRVRIGNCACAEES